MKITKQTKLSEAVTDNFRYAEVFEKYGLDYCCNGKRTIEDASTSKNLDPDKVISDLQNSTDTLSDEFFLNIDKWEVSHIIELINEYFHKQTIRKIEIINYLLERVCSVHGMNHQELIKLRDTFTILSHDMVNHMNKEEIVVFPYILELVNKTNNQTPPYGSIENPLSVLVSEHESAGKLMETIRELSNNFTPPDDACLKYKTLYKEFDDFEIMLHRHIHIENNILFDKAKEIEKRTNTFINN